MARLPKPALATANLAAGDAVNVEAPVLRAAELPSARKDSQVRWGAGLFWAAVAMLLLGGVAVGIVLAGNLSVANVRGDIVAGICLAAFASALTCAGTAIKRLLPKV
jgi:hypothetical protein